MKKIILLFILSVLSREIKSQNVMWARQGSDASQGKALGVGSDENGGLYVGGLISTPTVFDTITLSPLGGTDAYVAKYNRFGVIQWAISFGGPGDDVACDISTDLQGNTFVTGWVGSSATIGTYTFSSAYSINFFVARINSAGAIQWVKFFDNPGGLSEGKAIYVDGIGNTVVISGLFTYNADFDSIHFSGYYEDAFCAKVNGQTGDVIWIRSGGGQSDDEGQGVALDNDKNVIFSGYYKSTAYFDSVSFPAGAGHDIFLIKYDPYGNIIWAKSAIGPGQDDGYKVKTDNFNNIFLEGLYGDGVNFDGNVLTASGTYDAFLNKYDPSGNLKWIIHGGGPTSDVEVFSGFTFDNYGYLWCTGYFSGAATLGTFQVNAQASDIVLCKIDTSGQLLNVISYGGPGNDYGNAVIYVPECFIAVAGSFSDTASFGLSNLISGGADDACVVLVDATCTVNVKENDVTRDIDVYPNPFTSQFTIDLHSSIENGVCTVYNSLGECIVQKIISGKESMLDLSFLQKGLYEVQVISGDHVFHKRVVKQ
jgi:hypothetical protein